MSRAQQREPAYSAPYSPATRTPCGLVTTMPRMGSALHAIDADSPWRSRMATAPGLSVSPHSLCRGNVSRSSSRTRNPARASRIAVSAPAGPAPATRTQHPHGRASTSALFFDPNPRQLQSAASMRVARPCRGRKSMLQSGSGSSRLAVGGKNPREIARAVVTTPAAPLAPCGWPIIDFVEEPGIWSASEPNTGAPTATRLHRSR